jgi:hypothetical protein
MKLLNLILLICILVIIYFIYKELEDLNDRVNNLLYYNRINQNQNLNNILSDSKCSLNLKKEVDIINDLTSSESTNYEIINKNLYKYNNLVIFSNDNNDKDKDKDKVEAKVEAKVEDNNDDLLLFNYDKNKIEIENNISESELLSNCNDDIKNSEYAKMKINDLKKIAESLQIKIYNNKKQKTKSMLINEILSKKISN